MAYLGRRILTRSAIGNAGDSYCLLETALVHALSKFVPRVSCAGKIAILMYDLQLARTKE